MPLLYHTELTGSDLAVRFINTRKDQPRHKLKSKNALEHGKDRAYSLQGENSFPESAHTFADRTP